MIIGTHDTDHKVLIVAEIGNNHEGSVVLAERMIQRAAEAGVDAVKLQTIVPERMVSATQVNRIRQLRRFQLSRDDFKRLSRVAQACRVMFLSTPFDVDSVRFLSDLVPAFKIASGDNTFTPLLEAVARTGKPILLSAGLAECDELRQSKHLIEQVWRRIGCGGAIAVLHCVSSYPTPPEEANLLSIRYLRDQLGVTAGYSDHTLGIEACVLATALGARIIEKHFTLDKNYSAFHDHQLSADPVELEALVRCVRAAELMLGEYDKRLRSVERAGLTAWRRSVVAAHDLPAGSVIALQDIDWVRPGGGLSPGREQDVIGRVLRKPLRRGDMIVVGDTRPGDVQVGRHSPDSEVRRNGCGNDTNAVPTTPSQPICPGTV